MKRESKAKTMWAVVVHAQRSTWVNPHTIRWLRKDARRAYLDMFDIKDGSTFSAIIASRENIDWHCAKITVTHHSYT